MKNKLPIILIIALALSLHELASGKREQDAELLGKAIEYYQGRKYHECILTFEKLRRNYRLNPRFTAFLGFSYYKEQQYEEAVECLTEGIPSLSVYSPKEQAVYLYACAESLFHLGRYEEALNYYDKALPLTDGTDSADIHFHVGFCYINQMTADSLAARLNDSTALVHFQSANALYMETAEKASLDEMHTARLAQTTTMLRALMKHFEPQDTTCLSADTTASPTLPQDTIETLTLPQDTVKETL